ncbi:probable beta-1,4-xylosyltransferase IRX9H [Sesamum indicum]|uniref:Glycosyltransferases n=1 Tax=Sesamum indicum TaxID=4182 RepID=A0A6I9TDJ7_SESIN|nr:probable beta-1,4-xylosyltransferase IRX9H [Sesamum indicum]XP_011081808.1 probable beta-1,4-xylosyltransferase IRX9H [Sesamum indicum]
MASIRRTLSPVPRPGSLMNGEAYQVASPLSKSSSNSQNYPPHGTLSSSLGCLGYALYKAQNFFLGFFSQRSSRPFDRSKLKGQPWRRAILHFLMFFFLGVFVGLTPFVPLNLSANVVPEHQAFDFEELQPVVNNDKLYSGKKNEMSVVGRFSLNENSTAEPQKVNVELKDGTLDHAILDNSLDLSSDLVFHKLLIVVTPTLARPLQAYYLNRLAHTLKLVPHPLLWIVVEMNAQSAETAELLRKTGIMYRHLVCSIKNSTGITYRNVHLSNVALSHIETHRLDGIVYFADDDRIYSAHLFDQMRNISRFGTWTVAKLVESKGEISLEGPICNRSQVIGWHVDDMAKRFRRFHAEMSGFAFNSTIIWDPKRWHRPTIEPIRQLETVKEDMQASTFIEQVVEDESQMECFSMNTSGIMVWHHIMDSHPYPHN